MKIILSIFAAAMFIGLQGCASITKGTKDTVQVQVSNCAELMNCTATNKKGSWSFTAPGSVKFKKSDDDLTITCDDDGEVITRTLTPTRGGMIWGNVLIGGIIGGGVDSLTDAHWDMADSLVFPRNNCGEKNLAVSSQKVQGGQPETKSQSGQPETKSQIMQGCIDVCVANTSRSPAACFDICIRRVEYPEAPYSAPDPVQTKPTVVADISPPKKRIVNDNSGNESTKSQPNQSTFQPNLTVAQKSPNDTADSKPLSSQETVKVTEKRLNGKIITCTTSENVTECK